jgi:2-polyprenyl-6-methoxyphenol hydroxylase-like FAD-dependent oxidoreductase
MKFVTKDKKEFKTIANFVLGADGAYSRVRREIMRKIK